MRRLFFLAALLIGLLALVSGCSDDEETPTGGTGLVQGDTNDPTFQLVDSALEGVMYGWFDESMSLASALMVSIPGQVTGFHRSSLMTGLSTRQELYYTITAILSYEYTESGWFVFDFEAILAHPMDPDTTVVAGIDSIQWLRGGVPLDTLDIYADPDALKTRAHIGWSRGYEAEGFSNQQFDLETEVVSDGPVPVGGDTMLVINATNSDTLVEFWSDDSSSYTLHISSSTVAQDVRISPLGVEGEGCPESGSVSVYAAVHLGCAGACTGWVEEVDTDGHWSVTTTFTGNNSLTVRYSDGTTVWTWSGPCD